MSIITVILFFIYCWGTGFSATYFVKNSDNFLERNLMRIGIGLGILPILIYVLNLLYVPIDWKIYTIVSVAFPLFVFIKNKKLFSQTKLAIKKSDIYIFFVLLIFLFSLIMFLKGSFAYPWLENGDPWDYAVTAKYISIFKTTSPPAKLFDIYREKRIQYEPMISRYNEPYPQGYGIIMGLLNQTNSSVSWTLKFFNSLIISVALIFFYFFAKEFIGDKNKALFSTFVLAAVPCFVSHFIYSQALAITLFLPAFYALEMTKHDKRWAFVAVPIIASILITQSSSAGMFGAIFFPIYWLGKVFVNKKFMIYIFFAGILGLILSFAFWGSMIYKYTWEGTDPNHGDKDTSIFKSGLARDVYTLKDFYQAKAENKIDNPIGLGPVVFALTVISIIIMLVNYRSSLKTEWIIISFLWLIVNYINVNGSNLPVNINTHRGWSFFAIAVAIFVSYGTWQILGFFKKNSVSRLTVTSVFVILVLATSAYPKYVVNTVQWPTHYFTSFSDIPGYMWLENLPDNTPVTSLCRYDEKVIGMDMYSTKMWDLQQLDFQNVVLNKSMDKIHSFVKEKNYSYMIVDSSCVDKFGINRTNERLKEFIDSNKLSLVYPYQQDQPMSTFIFKIL